MSKVALVSKNNSQDSRFSFSPSTLSSGARRPAPGALFLLWLSSLLLLHDLGARSLWIDEFDTVQLIQGSALDVVQATIRDLHPPLYFLALHAWTAWAGTSELALRWPSVAGGLVGAALLAAIARRLAGGRLALPATAFLALSPAFVEFCRMARYYSWVMALGLASTWLLLQALERGGWRRWAAYALANLALLYTFYPSGILLAAHGLGVVWPGPGALERGTSAPGADRASTGTARLERGASGPGADRAQASAARRAWLLSALACATAFAPWAAVVAGRQVLHVSGGTSADLARSAAGFVLGLAASFYTFSVGETLFPWQPVAWAGLGAMAVLLAAGWRRPTPEPDGGDALAARHATRLWHSSAPARLCVVSVVGLAAHTKQGAVPTPILNVPVRALFALPYFALWAAGGWARLAASRVRLALGLALVAAWGFSLFNQYAGQEFLNPIYLTPAKEAAAFVRAQSAPDDWVVSDYDSVFGYYFVPGDASAQAPAGRPRHFYAQGSAQVQAALQQDPHPPRVWLVTLGRDRTRDDPGAGLVRQALAEAGYRLDSTYGYVPIDPLYLRVKNLLLGRSSYTYRLTVEVYAPLPLP